jgi:hypothetical protein
MNQKYIIVLKSIYEYNIMTDTDKKICFIYCDTNGLNSNYETVSKKNLYSFARIISLHYCIGYYTEDDIKIIKEHKYILYPDCINFNKDAIKIHKITIEDAIKNGTTNDIVISQLKEDLLDVDVIVSYNTLFHLKAIQVECFRTAISIEFNKKIIIDINSFSADITSPKLVDLGKKLKIAKKNNLSNIMLIINIFANLYKKYLTELK